MKPYKTKGKRTINWHTGLPKLATILPLVAIGANLVLNLWMNHSFTTNDYIAGALGLAASLYFGVFCKDLSGGTGKDSERK